MKFDVIHSNSSISYPINLNYHKKETKAYLKKTLKSLICVKMIYNDSVNDTHNCFLPEWGIALICSFA